MSVGEGIGLNPPPAMRPVSPLISGGNAVVRAARGWIGTPYQHQASLKGVGCDCLGLVRAVWRELCGEEPVAVPPYSPDWAEVGSGEHLIEALGACMRRVELGQAVPGDVLVFRMQPGAIAKHAAILSAERFAGEGATIIHAYWGRAVVESWLGAFWRRHAVASFRFPDVGEMAAPSGASRHLPRFAALTREEK